MTVIPYESDLDLKLELWGDLCERPIVKVACSFENQNDQCPEQCKDGGSDFQWEDITDKVPPFAVQDEKYKTSSLDSNFTKMRVKLEKDGEEFTKEFTPSDIEVDIIKVDLSTTVNRLKELNPLAQSNFEVNYNTSEEDAKKVLPSKATITDTAEAEHQVDLTWTVDGYKADIAGDYTATAHFTLPEGVKQSKPETELQYTAKITVKADPLVEKKAKVDALKILVDNQVELAEQVVYVGKNGMNSLNWSNETPLGELEPQACILKGADEALYDRHAGSGDTFNESFAKCSGLLTPSKYRSYAFPEQQYTLTVDFGDEIKKVYAFSFEKMPDVERKTDYDPTQSTNEMVKKHYVARSGTPLVDVKEGMEFQAGNPAKYQHLMFLYKVNNLQGAEKTRYEIRLNDNQGDVIAYGHREQVKALDGFVWSFRDWRADPQFKVEDIDQYRGGPAGLTVVEARNDDILKVGTKVVFIVKLKYADREETIEYPYTLTQEDVISASIGDKVILTFKDGDQELSKQVLLSGTAAIMPANPSKSGYTFLGWTTDKEGKQKFDATTKL